MTGVASERQLPPLGNRRSSLRLGALDSRWPTSSLANTSPFARERNHDPKSPCDTVKVLIADDNPVWTTMLAKIVSGCDFEPITVTNGRDAIRRLAGGDAPRIAFLDWEMPGLTGLEICRRIKRAEHRPFTYVVMLTGRDDKQDMVAGLDAGADDYLTKPVEPVIIRSRLVAARRIIEAIPPPEWAKPQVNGYEVSRVIGKGAFASVWEADHLATGRKIALKLLRVDLATDQVFNRFAREVDVVRRLQHPNLASVYDAQISRQLGYIAMDLIDGETLEKHVRLHSPSKLDLIRIMASVCEGLHHAHEHGVVHRDLKPSNIMVENDSLQPKLLDFGLCKSMFESQQDSAESVDGLPIGSPLFMSPEQIRGIHSEVDRRCDIYAIGVSLYMMLLRRHPVVANTEDRTAAIDALRSGTVRPPRELNPKFSKLLERILLKSLARGSGRSLRDREETWQ